MQKAQSASVGGGADAVERHARRILNWLDGEDLTALGALDRNGFELAYVDEDDGEPSVATARSRCYFSNVAAIESIDRLVVWCVVTMDPPLSRGDRDASLVPAVVARIMELRGPFAPPTAADRARWAACIETTRARHEELDRVDAQAAA